MPSRNVLLGVLFWCLGLSAVLGAAGVVFARFETLWRIIVTMVLTGVGSGLLIACAALVERPRTRTAGLFYVALVVVQFLLSMALVWIEPRSHITEERLALTIVFNFLVGLPAGAMLIVVRLPRGRWASRCLLGFAGAIWLLLMVGLWGSSHLLLGDAPEYAAAIAAFAPIFFFALLGQGTDRRHWRWIGIAAGVVGLAITCYAIHYRLHSDAGWLVCIISVGAVAAHWNSAALVPLKPAQRWVRWVTVAAIGGVAVLVDAVALTEIDFGRETEPLTRAASALGIIAACGTLAMLVLAIINRKVERPLASITTIDQITLICPMCNAKHTLKAGEDRCPSCNLIFHIRFEEPHCPRCDYSLLMLKSDHCPECGAEVSRNPAALEAVEA